MLLKKWNCINVKKEKEREIKRIRTSHIWLHNALVHFTTLLQQSRTINLFDRGPLSRAAKSLSHFSHFHMKRKNGSKEVSRTEEPITKIVIDSAFPCCAKEKPGLVVQSQSSCFQSGLVPFLNIITKVAIHSSCEYYGVPVPRV